MENESKSSTPDFFSGLSENAASALCYSLAFISGLVFLLVDKRERVRYNAAQSLVVFGLIFVAFVVAGFLPFIGLVISPLLAVGSLLLWLFLIIKSYQGKDYKIVQVESLVKKILGRV